MISVDTQCYLMLLFKHLKVLKQNVFFFVSPANSFVVGIFLATVSRWQWHLVHMELQNLHSCLTCITRKQFNLNISMLSFLSMVFTEASCWQVHYNVLICALKSCLQEEDESKMHDTDLDVDRFTSMTVDYSSVHPGSQQLDR